MIGFGGEAKGRVERPDFAFDPYTRVVAEILD
jgi:hypothetical protein